MSAPAPWQAPWQATVLTLFPDMFPGPLGLSLAGKALAAETWRLETVDIRAHARDRHRSVDDTPFGGGSGMVMRADVTAAALDAVADPPGRGRYFYAGAPPPAAGGGGGCVCECVSVCVCACLCDCVSE